MNKGSPSEIDMYTALESVIFQRKRAVDFMQEGVAITDPKLQDNPMVYVNDAFLKLTGYQREDVIGKNCRFLQGKKSDPQTVALLREKIAKKESVTAELVNYRKDGTPFWNHLTISPVRNEHGVVVNFVAIQRDVTEIRNNQNKIDAMQKAIELLKHRVEEQEDVIASFIMNRPEEPLAFDILGLESGE